LSLFLVSASFAAVPTKPFWFVQITDTHIGVSGADEKLSATLLDIKRNFPATEFVVNTGDLTEMGSEDQLTTYVQLIKSWPFPVYNTVGNHDARWSPSGKEKFRELVGPTRFTFEHRGVRFFFLDVSVVAEHHGHFNADDLQWLDEELAKLPPEAPAVICVHHPPLFPGSTIDNDTEFGKIIARHNVPLVLVGHGHTFHRYTLNGTTFAMGGSTSYAKRIGQPCYRAYYVDMTGFLPYLRVVSRDVTTSESLIPIQKPSDPYGELVVKQPEIGSRKEVYLDCRITSTAKARLTTGTYELDKAYRGVYHFLRDGRFRIRVSSLAPGAHRLTVTFVDDKMSTYSRSTLFNVAPPRTADSPRFLRKFEMPSTIQSSPAVHKNLMYVGCNDGTLRAFDLLSGSTFWQRKLGAEIISTPAVTDNLLVVGCSNSLVYCFDAYTGVPRWEFRTNGAVLASPRIADDTVYVGSGDGYMYALDLETGRLRWKFAAENMIKCRPALARDNLFFGAWDNWFYNVDAQSGQLVWKVPVSVTRQFSAATANPATTGTRVLFTSHDYCVRCLDQKTGSHLWMYRPQPDELGPSYSSFVFYQNVAYSGSIAGSIVGFDLLSGKKVADIPVRVGIPDELFDSAPVLDGHFLYVGSTGGNVYCVDLAANKVRWSFSLQPGFIFSAPALWGDRLFVASMTGTIYEISRPEASGKLPFEIEKPIVPLATHELGSRSW
jgi:outer membrane protein assembly factor BamB